MKTRTTLTLFILAASLFAFLYFYESKLPGTRDAEDQKSRVMQLDRDNVDAVTITNKDDRIELRKQDNEWFVEKPVKDRADAGVVAALFTSAETLKKEAVIGADGDKPDFKEYGLGNAALRLKFGGKKAPPEIWFGKDAAVEGKVYARLEKGDEAFLVSADLKNQLTRKADDFRDHRLTDLTAAQIQKFTIKGNTGEIELEKKGDHWQLNKPLSARADDSKVADTIAQALTTRIDSFVSETEAAASGLNESRGTLAFHAEGEDKPTLLHVGRASATDAEKVFARLSNRDSVYLLPSKIEDVLNLKPNDLRDKHLVRVEPDMIDRIHIEPAGGPKTVLARKQEDWTIHSAGDRPANSDEIRRLLEDLRGATVTAFASDVASDLAKFGLDQPSLQVTFSAFASENTAESSAGDNPIVSIHFGKTEGDQVFARLDNEPFVVSVPAGIKERVFTNPAQWQNVVIFKLKPDGITELQVSKAGRPAVTLSRTGKTWKTAADGAAVHENHVQSLLNTLAALRAARWASSADVAAGGEKLDLAIAFTADGKSQKLQIGGATPDGMWVATADGVEGTFVLPRPDVEALQLPLVQTAARLEGLPTVPTEDAGDMSEPASSPAE